MTGLASTLDLLRGHPDIHTELSDQGFYDYLYFHVSPAGHTQSSRACSYSPAGHYLEFDGAGASAPRPYWSMRFKPNGDRPLQALEDEFVAVLQDAVKVVR